MSLPGFEVAETVAWKGLERLRANPNIVHRGRHIASLLQDALNFAFLTLREKDPHPLSLARVSVPLAWCEAIYRAGPITALTNDLGRQIKRARTAVELMMSIDDSLIFDIAKMHKSLIPLLEEWNGAVSDGVDYTPNPTFPGALAIGGADADLAINDLLVDFKTREEIINPWLRDTLFQMLGYTLLDLDDSLGIRRVAILLPRQPYIAIWTLDDLRGRDADEALPKLREAFAGLLTTMLSSQLGEDEAEDEETGVEPDRITT